jgi:hypothetical protein
VRERLPFAVAVTSLLVALPGCEGGPSYATVSGRVTLDGKPLAKASVTFIPVPPPGSQVAGDAASGVTDENGMYTLKTFTSKGWKDGVQVGKHRVAISQQETRGEGDRSVTIQRLPKKYNETTELTADVAAGTNQRDFPLQSR